MHGLCLVSQPKKQFVFEVTRQLPTGPPHQFVASFGAEKRLVVNGNFRTALSERPTANLELRATDPPVDYALPLGLELNDSSGTDAPLFSGHVVRATPDGDRIKVVGEGAREMVETLTAATISWGLDPREMVYSVGRGAGLSPDRIVIENYDGPQLEPILVQVPVEGLETTDRLDVGRVWFESAAHSTDVPSPAEMFAKVGQEGIPAVANVLVTGKFLYDAEVEAMKIISNALNTLMTASLYSLIDTPRAKFFRSADSDSDPDPPHARLHTSWHSLAAEDGFEKPTLDRCWITLMPAPWLQIGQY